MNTRASWAWLGVAACLFGFIVFYQRPQHKQPSGPMRVLPSLKASQVSAIQIRPAGAGQLRIRTQRTNDTWQLTEPLVYPAQAASIDRLLTELQRLTPAPYISARELRNRPKVDEAYGFANPQASIVIEQPEHPAHLLIGAIRA